MTKRVFLHIGSPKTGTTYLQTLLWDNREALRDEHGVLFPGERYDSHFLAAVDLQDGLFHGSPRPEAQGHWERVVEQARDWPGTVVISHEILAGASAEHARRAVEAFGPAEVHIVHTIRDLARQLPSRWQEDVKHGAVEDFDQWWASVRDRDQTHHFTRWFWPTEDPLDILSRWGGTVPPERYHVVSVPRAGGRGSLWERFCSVIGLDAGAVDVAAATISNPGLGTAEVELVRRINVQLDGSLSPTLYQHLVKGALAHDTLTRHPGGRRLTVPADILAQLQEISLGWLTGLRESGVHLVIEDDEVLPRPASGGGGIGTPTEEDLAGAAVFAVRELLLKLEAERQHHAALRERLETDRRHVADELDRDRAELECVRAELDRVRAELVRKDVVGRVGRRLARYVPEPRSALSGPVPARD